MNEKVREEKIQQITSTEQTLKFYSSMILFFAILFFIVAIAHLYRSKEITFLVVIESIMPGVFLLLLTGFFDQLRQGFEAIKALLKDQE